MLNVNKIKEAVLGLRGAGSKVVFGLVIVAALGLAWNAISPARARPVVRQVSHGMVGAVAFPDAPAMSDTPAADEPGVILTISPQDAAAVPGIGDVRVARMVAFYSSHGAAPSLFLSHGSYKATFEGDISMRLRDFLIFSAVGKGKLTLTINGKSVLELSGDLAQMPSESTRLGKGKNHLVALYEPPAEGDGELRLFWGTKTTLAEPLPPTVLSHSNGDKSLRQSLRVREGRFLVAQLRCTKCHAVTDIVGIDAKGAMPELAMDAPALAEVGSRLETSWMARWISDPRKLRSIAHMPRLFDAKDPVAPEAHDIAAFLAAKFQSPGVKLVAEAGKVEAGGRLFANLDCVACHISPVRNGEPSEANDGGRISLANVKFKFKPGALKLFLLNPSAHYAWISMPNFRLSDEEAENLATFLRSIEGGSPMPDTAGDVANGERLFHSSGCIHCHAMPEKQRRAEQGKLSVALGAISKEGWARGCMAAAVANRSHAPDFSLTESQRAAILAFVATDRLSLKRDTPAEFSQRQMTALRCTACHARDGRESLLATDLDAENQQLHNKFPNAQQSGGEGIAPDQRTPKLTWAGEKLRPEWMQRFIAGQIPYKPRYYLRARMPGFGIRAELLSPGLNSEHGCPPIYPAYGPPNKALADVGQMLVGKTPNRSFGCVQCHSISQQAALAPFEAPAINLMYVSARLREDYYYRWIHDPLRIDPDTKMPRFDDADGKTGVPVFDNDARKQYEAIWNYLLIGKDITPPAQ